MTFLQKYFPYLVFKRLLEISTLNYFYLPFLAISLSMNMKLLVHFLIPNLRDLCNFFWCLPLFVEVWSSRLGLSHLLFW